MSDARTSGSFLAAILLPCRPVSMPWGRHSELARKHRPGGPPCTGSPEESDTQQVPQPAATDDAPDHSNKHIFNAFSTLHRSCGCHSKCNGGHRLSFQYKELWDRPKQARTGKGSVLLSLFHAEVTILTTREISRSASKFFGYFR